MCRSEVQFSCLAIVLSVAFLRVSSASAEPAPVTERLSIGRVNWSGNIPQPLRRSLLARLTGGLKAVAFEVVGPSEDSSAVLVGPGQMCQDAECWRQTATHSGVSYLVSVNVAATDKSFAIVLELISGRSGAVVGTNRERCEICGSEEVGEKMALAAATLRTRLETLAEAPARFVIRSSPESARVKVDGKLVGQSPVDVYLKSGQHQVVIEHDGWSPLERTITATSGVDETLDLQLVRPADSFPFGVAGWAAIGAGVALAGGGMYFLSKDGDQVSCTKDEKDGDGDCPRIYDTKLLGASLLGLSAVSITLGGMWLYMDQPGAEPPTNEQAQARRPTRRMPRFLLGTSGRF
jgi:PEGA domain